MVVSRDAISKSRVLKGFEIMGSIKIGKLSQDFGNLDEWCQDTAEVVEKLRRLLGSSPTIFWSTLAHGNGCVGAIDDILQFYASDSAHFYLSCEDETVRALFQQLFQTIFLFVLRAITNIDGSNDAAGQIDEKTHAHLLYTSRTITVETLFKVAFVFGPVNSKLLCQAFEHLFRVQPKYGKDLVSFVHSSSEFLKKSHLQLAQLVTGRPPTTSEARRSRRQQIVFLLDNATNLCALMDAFFCLYFSASVDNDSLGEVLKILILTIPSLVGSVSTDLRDEVVAQMFTSRQIKFLVRLDDCLTLSSVELPLLKDAGVCTDEHLRAVKKALEEAYQLRAIEKQETLLQQGTLKNIGTPSVSHVAHTIQDLGDLMPDLSKEQIHLCLRHFGYVIEQTTHALCERDELPLDLRCFLRAPENVLAEFDHSTGVEMPELSDDITNFSEEDGDEDKDQSSSNIQLRGHIVDLAPSSDALTRQATNFEDADEDEQRRAAAASEIAKMIDKFGGRPGVDLKDLEMVMDSISKADAFRRDTVEIEGKKMVRQEYQKREFTQLKADEKVALRQKTQALGNMGSEDEEDFELEFAKGEAEVTGQRAAELEAMKQLREEREDQRLAAKYGITGRFNRDTAAKRTKKRLVGQDGQSTRGGRGGQKGDDGADVSIREGLFDYDEVEESDSDDLGDETIPSREDSTGPIRQKLQTVADRLSASVENKGQKKGAVSGAQIDPKKDKTQKHQTDPRGQKPIKKNAPGLHREPVTQIWREKAVSNAKNKIKDVKSNISRVQKVDEKSNAPPPGFEHLASSIDSDNRPLQKQKDEKTPPPPGFGGDYREEETFGGRGGSHCGGHGNRGGSSSGNYTGGFDRRKKEQNKSKHRQRGADRKARGGMF